MRENIPAIGVVEVGEEKNSTDEKSDQHECSINFMKESVLLLVLKHDKKDRQRRRKGDTGVSTRQGEYYHETQQYEEQCCVCVFLRVKERAVLTRKLIRKR